MSLHFETVSPTLIKMLQQLMKLESMKDDTIEIDGLRLADEKEIAAMKLLAIGNGSYRQKDYWDIRELLDSYSLKEMIQWSLQRHPYTIDEKDIVLALQNVDLVQESTEGIDSLRHLDFWELKKAEIKDYVARYLAKKA